MTLCALCVESLKFRREASELPAHDGPAGIGKLPSSRLILMTEVLAGCARERAEARQGSTLERSFGGEDACHRNVDDPRFDSPCQPLYRRRRIAGCSRLDATRQLHRERDRAIATATPTLMRPRQPGTGTAHLYRLPPGRGLRWKGRKRREALPIGRASYQHLPEWRGWDLNPRPSGYEPDELPNCSTPRREGHSTADPRRVQRAGASSRTSGCRPRSCWRAGRRARTALRDS
jgi:hypothetical protein